VDGGDNLQMRVAANVLNKQSWSPGKGCSFSLRIGWEQLIVKKTSMLKWAGYGIDEKCIHIFRLIKKGIFLHGIAVG
jgi:hypothetical protein